MSKDEKQTKKPANNNSLKIRKGGLGAVARQLMGMDPMQPSPHGSGKFIGPWGGPMPPGLGLVAAEMMGLQAQPLKQQNTQMENPFFGPALGLMSSQGQMPRMPMKGGGFGPGYDPWRSLQIK